MTFFSYKITFFYLSKYQYTNYWSLIPPLTENHSNVIYLKKCHIKVKSLKNYQYKSYIFKCIGKIKYIKSEFFY